MRSASEFTLDEQVIKHNGKQGLRLLQREDIVKFFAKQEELFKKEEGSLYKILLDERKNVKEAKAKFEEFRKNNMVLENKDLENYVKEITAFFEEKDKNFGYKLRQIDEEIFNKDDWPDIEGATTSEEDDNVLWED